jgi:hypothetical protein
MLCHALSYTSKLHIIFALISPQKRNWKNLGTDTRRLKNMAPFFPLVDRPLSLCLFRHNIIVEVMPLCGGHLPLPTVRLSKYIPAEGAAGLGGSSGPLAGARLDPFAPWQVYNMSRAQQIHVLPPANQGQEYLSLP